MAAHTPPDGPEANAVAGPWYKAMNRYHWVVLVIASLGWLFDCMDQQLFNLARRPALAELMGVNVADPLAAARVAEYAGYVTSIFIVGWASGGLIFGILGDRIGRVKTMIISILCYSGFTGLAALSTGVWDFTAYRFLTGLGVGGQFAVAASLVAETVPDRARPFALGWFQAASVLGNITAALTGIALGQLEEAGMVGGTWRFMFLVGTVPAFLCFFIFRRLKEPERWQKAADAKEKLGSMKDLFSHPRWRRNTIVGMLLAFSGVVGLWGIGFFSFDLLRTVLDQTDMSEGQKTLWTSLTSLFQNVGAFFGIYAFTHITRFIGRKKAFAGTFLAAMFVTAFTFWNFDSFGDIFWMIPLMGGCQLALFGGYAIYLPELFPTRLRATGTSFCYNVGRIVAAIGPTALGLLTSRVYVNQDEPMRYAGVTMCLVFLIGLAVLPFAPETKDQPLPETD